MDPKEPDDQCTTNELEEETIARQKKRARRVSFADITSVHVFYKDEEMETPPDARPEFENAELGQRNEALAFQRDFGDSDDSKESSQRENDDEEGDEDEEEERLFVQNMNLSSPGSEAGSVMSNEDNFFGPVSTDFIRSGRLSTESATSNDNHDVTMDSTAFSLHFRSLVQSDKRLSNAEGNFRTPTGDNLPFSEKTPTGDSLPGNPDSFMLLTGIKKPIAHCVSDGKSNTGSDSDYMKSVVANPHKYDYGRLSPSLDALLAEARKDTHPLCDSNQSNPSKSFNSESKFSALCEPGIHFMDPKNFGNERVDNFEGDSIPAITKVTLPADIADEHLNQTHNGSTQGMFYDVDKDSSKGVLEMSQSQIELGSTCNGSNLSPMNSKSTSYMIMQQDHQTIGHIGDILEENHYFSRSSSMPVAKSPASTLANSQPKSSERPRDGPYTPTSSQNADQGNEFSSFSVSSLRAKRRRVFCDADVSSISGWLSSPFAREQLFSSVNKEGVEHGVSISSAKNSISKFKNVELQDVVVDNSKSSLSRPPFEDIMEGNKDPNSRHMGASVVSIEGHSLNNAEKKTVQEIAMETSSSIENPTNFIILRHNQSNKLMEATVSPHQVSGLREHIQKHPLNFRITSETAVATPIPYSSHILTTPNHKETNQVTGSPNKFKSSPREEKLFASGRPMGTPLQILNPQDQSGRLVDTTRRQDTEGSIRISRNLFRLSPGAEGTTSSSFLLRETREDFTMPSIDYSSELRNFCKREEVANEESFPHGLEKDPGNMLSHRITLNIHSGSQDRSFPTWMGPEPPAKTREKSLPEGELTASSHEFAPDIHKKIATPAQSGKGLVERVVQSALRKKTFHLLDHDSVHSLSVDGSFSSKPSQGSHQSPHNLQKALFIPDRESSGRKIKISEAITLVDKDHMENMERTKNSLKFHPEAEASASGYPSDHSIISSNEAEKIIAEVSRKQWSDVYSKFSSATKQVLPTLIDKLNSRKLGILEDILDMQQKAKKYQILCTEIHAQKINDVDSIRQQRVVEAKLLQTMLMYEQAKLPLQRLKRREVQQLQLGIQECCSHNNILQNHTPGTSDAQNKARYPHSLSPNFDSKNQDSHHRVARMKHELAGLEKEIKDQIKSFHSSCKIKGNPSVDETIILINDHLQKRARCRIICRYLQLWELGDIERKDGHRSIVLNFVGLLSQRLTKNGPFSSIVSFNMLNDSNIMKNFPNMNARTAFDFVFIAKSDRRLGNPKSFQQEAQVTSLLLGNLLDVIEEVQGARIELPNLINACFDSPCTARLDLQLCFVDFKSGRKATLILDMTDLNCALYPSEILPSQLQIQTSGTQTAPSSLSSEIKDAIQSLKAGHSMILRLCQCVSQVVQDLSR
ncbi:uncharacterized protein LOC143879198 isoform X2 [Tasmannia lanceolata]|uniref:uncharacterized protein LOC143879198 isoform X2 n=1 Tax=Tasmannia lanceolata TaxID=3420 RepID=UPI004063CE7C